MALTTTGVSVVLAPLVLVGVFTGVVVFAEGEAAGESTGWEGVDRAGALAGAEAVGGAVFVAAAVVAAGLGAGALAATVLAGALPEAALTGVLLTEGSPPTAFWVSLRPARRAGRNGVERRRL